jgi:hypothetical protein
VGAVCAATISQFVELKQASLQGLCNMPDGNRWDNGTWLPWDEVEDENCKCVLELKMHLAFFFVLLLTCRATCLFVIDKRSSLRVDWQNPTPQTCLRCGLARGYAEFCMIDTANRPLRCNFLCAHCRCAAGGIPGDAFFYEAWKDHPGPVQSTITKGKKK